MATRCSDRTDIPVRRGGGCAFCGAKMSLQPIVDAVHLIHGPMICLGHSWDSRPTASSGSRLHRTNFTTSLTEMDIALGGERKLAGAIDSAVDRHDPAAVFVYQTCVPAMIGDDLAAICRAAAGRVGRPVVPVDLSGLNGGKDHGTRAAGDVLLDHVIGTREPERLTDTDIILIGEYNVAGELGHIRALLAELGLRVLASIPGDGRYAAIAGSHRARAAITFCSRAFDGLAEAMRDRYGIPFIHGSFYGSANISATLRGIAALLVERGAPSDLSARTEALIRREEARIESSLAPIRQRLRGKRALLGTGGVKSWSLVAALQQIGLDVVGTSVTKSSTDECRRAAGLAGADRLTAGLDFDRLGLGGIDVVLSGGIHRLKAIRAGAAWVEVNHERRLALTGYDGTLRLAAAIEAAITHPLAAGSTDRPPWERTDREQKADRIGTEAKAG
ncbi:nitrogenase component 1 [Magnetospirillum fulvum]|uniref:Nitrogenase molybdenum-cofactor synthesis protein NifE n=1 Tax=Magnetospirillum fulvum TaxID=1082 RepID=A0A1H6IQX5_MAGFU|nr:nitrogenase component 1 [Magnetospirillum fulvum]SEH51198.1 nitrogenase molybdenum-cofactor synthesis protein NifE [Magnetospirillum fulvum]